MERDISSKVFGTLKELLPDLGRIAVLATRSIWTLFAPGQDEAAKALGLEYIYIDMPQPVAVNTSRRPPARTLGPTLAAQPRLAVVVARLTWLHRTQRSIARSLPRISDLDFIQRQRCGRFLNNDLGKI